MIYVDWNFVIVGVRNILCRNKNGGGGGGGGGCGLGDWGVVLFGIDKW